MSEPLILPFRGGRSYVPLADMMAHAAGLVESETGRPRLVRLGGYRMIETPHLSLCRSDMPLSPKAHDAVAEIGLEDGRSIHLGYAAAPGRTDPAPELPCFEPLQRDHVEIHPGGPEGISATLRNEASIGAPLPFWLVYAIKAASRAAYPGRRGKWIAAKAELTGDSAALAGGWREARVETSAAESARFFAWSVSIDGASAGTIVFFNAPEDA